MEAVDLLKRQGFNIISVSEFSPGLSDRRLLEVAKSRNGILVTFDRDFGPLLFKEKLETKGVILLMFVPKSPQLVAKRIKQVLSAKICMDNTLVTVREDRIKVASVR
jgi:hypothetical protein